jgi:hypothetical protein
MDWVDLAQDRDQWRVIFNTVINRITGVSDFIHRPYFNNYKKKNKHDVSETGSVSVLR